ncbi:hypothetical protein QAD02_016068 [Eretmocerus hayati]|uniref:Uncharacterized protein n=1 Tax=Eretmocerus hayati TaxID=131215 RepID=A0ACC2PBB9_9HYME|nr:hypothetical protein QAD02_016068 [Eretmocerus hayati]
MPNRHSGLIANSLDTAPPSVTETKIVQERHRLQHRRLMPCVSLKLRKASLSTFILLTLLVWSTSLCPMTMARQNLHQTCPGCPHQQHAHPHRKGNNVNPDELRLEAIKHQILSKLGLKNRPDVNRTVASVPKRLALETIYRAEHQQPTRSEDAAPSQPYHQDLDFERNKISSPYDDSFGNGDMYSYKNVEQTDEETMDNQNLLPYQDYDEPFDPQDSDVADDFYARTSEIITFAEPGEKRTHCQSSLYLGSILSDQGEIMLIPVRD